MKRLKEYLETLYNQYNKPEFIHPDPLEFLYNYKEKKDIEIVGLIASSLAYGRVNQILKALDKIFKKMGKSPYDYIFYNEINNFKKDFKEFKYRFTDGNDISNLLNGIKGVLHKYKSLYNLFYRYYKKNPYLPITLENFLNEIRYNSNSTLSFLLPFLAKKSACKRINLFLRWMIRKDNVDLGIWPNIPKNILIIPLDTHMHRIALQLNLTNRKQANLKTAIEITEAFKQINPDDPIKYDFSLTRFGIKFNKTLHQI